jgi:hypothetical protein
MRLVRTGLEGPRWSKDREVLIRLMDGILNGGAVQ